MPVLYCPCEAPIMDTAHDSGCRRCGRPVDFSPAPLAAAFEPNGAPPATPCPHCSTPLPLDELAGYEGDRPGERVFGCPSCGRVVPLYSADWLS